MPKRWYGEYLSLLKKVEAEEVLDLIFYRPLAFLFVKAIYYTNLTPNQITLLAILWALIGTLLYLKGLLIWAALSLVLYDIFDCADGMLARLKKNGTALGRVIDGFGDYISTAAVYFAIGFAFANKTADPLFYWALTVLAAASNIFHAVLLDYYRNRYLDYAFDRKPTLGDDLEEYKREFEKLKSNHGHWLSKLLYKIYFGYSRLQSKVAPGKNRKQLKIFEKNNFLKRNAKLIKLWTFLGPTTEWTFLWISILIGRIDIYLWGLITAFNFYALLTYVFQIYTDSKTIKIN